MPLHRAARGPRGSAHGVREYKVVVGPAILSLKGKPPRLATAGGLPVRPGCGACEKSAARYGVAKNGRRSIQKKAWNECERSHLTARYATLRMVTGQSGRNGRGPDGAPLQMAIRSDVSIIAVASGCTAAGSAYRDDGHGSTVYHGLSGTILTARNGIADLRRTMPMAEHRVCHNTELGWAGR